MTGSFAEVAWKMWDKLEQAHEFGVLASRRRRVAGLTQDDVALALGESSNKSLISRIENGKTLSSPETISVVAARVGIIRGEIEQIFAGMTADDITNRLSKEVPEFSLDLLENLAQRFGHENPDAPTPELVAHLKKCAKEFGDKNDRLHRLEGHSPDLVDHLWRLANKDWRFERGVGGGFGARSASERYLAILDVLPKDTKPEFKGTVLAHLAEALLVSAEFFSGKKAYLEQSIEAAHAAKEIFDTTQKHPKKLAACHRFIDEAQKKLSDLKA